MQQKHAFLFLVHPDSCDTRSHIAFLQVKRKLHNFYPLLLLHSNNFNNNEFLNISPSYIQLSILQVLVSMRCSVHEPLGDENIQAVLSKYVLHSPNFNHSKLIITFTCTCCPRSKHCVVSHLIIFFFNFFFRF